MNALNSKSLKLASLVAREILCQVRVPCVQGHLKFDNIIIAHRGGRPLLPENITDDSDFPENTISAYKWASKCKGAEAIELDTWLSKDHIPMVVHDSYLASTLMNCQGYISQFTCAELQQMRFIRQSEKSTLTKIDVYETECIPTLEEVIKFLEPTHLKLMIEIKEIANIKKMSIIISELYQKYPYLYERSFCASFIVLNLYLIRLLNSRIITGYIFVNDLTTYLINNAAKTPKPTTIFIRENLILRYLLDKLFWWFGTPSGLKLIGCNIACMKQTEVNERLIKEYKENNIVLAIWCVNSREQKIWLKSKEVTIITDTQFD
ncbi:unnamed protein product [Didymodactylos carnosus]|uniref:GP-PDE domain-containing protein n=1 Tax=Didymodactylos carnosus TaxID=1234261 RepID=A0A8S2DTV3_9BILA|nr:unnamed protein product [Didymodactylos carnosus]CAF3801534.1 unnamed protein product [Didymodactylos carnosus]